MSINSGKLTNSKVTNTITYINKRKPLKANQKYFIQETATNNNLLLTKTALPDYTIKYESKTRVEITAQKGNRTYITGSSFRNTTSKAIKWILNN